MIIVDTNVISEMMRPKPEERVAAWYLRQRSSSLHTTAITLSEVLFGLNLMPTGQRRDRLANVSAVLFNEGFRGRIISFDEQAAVHYARMRAAKRQQGLSMSPQDAQIAAIAFAAGASVATRNVTDFDHCGITVINPWSA